MATASAFAAAPWTDATRPMAVNLQQDLQRALWAIENDLVVCCQVSVDRYGQPWDSHWDNHRVQASTSRSTIPLIAQFLRELGERRNAHGVLADQTLVVLGSELGRFPRLNGAQGKDHWPEAPACRSTTEPCSTRRTRVLRAVFRRASPIARRSAPRWRSTWRPRRWPTASGWAARRAGRAWIARCGSTSW
jgi:hypothetical protein